MKRFLSIINALVLLLCYCCLLNQFVGPNATSLFQFISLGFPILLIINCLLIFLWLFIKPSYALISLFLSLFLVIPSNRIYNLYDNNVSPTSNFKIMSYNVYYFFEDREGIKNLIKKEKPDLIMFQEIGDHIEDILPKSKKYYANDFSDLGIASKYPIIEINKINDGDKKLRSSYADIKINNDTIRAINVYLAPFHIEKKLVKSTINKDKFQESYKILYKKLTEAFKKHQKEVNIIKKFVENSPHPVILGGDFNSVPNSYEYFKLKANLDDTFYNKGEGLGTTFHNFKFPIKIDYIFTSKKFKTHSAYVKQVHFSDHFPIFAEIKL